MKSRMVVWFRMVFISCLTSWSGGWQGAAQHYRSIVLHITSPGEDQTSRYDFFWTNTTFAPLWSQKILSLTIANWGPSVHKWHFFTEISWRNKEEMKGREKKERNGKSKKTRWKKHHYEPYILLLLCTFMSILLPLDESIRSS